MTEVTLYLGIDGGGTKCAARLFSSEGQELGVGQGGPANAYQSLELAQKSIIESALSALDSANLSREKISQLIVGAGLAGVNVPGVFQAMQSWAHPFQKFQVTTDVHIACVGAHQKNTGAIVIVGTGTCGYARIESKKNTLEKDNVEEFFVGGHGFPIGDQAGGAWMGFEAVRAVLLAQDGMISPTLLTQKILNQWKILPDKLLDKIALATSADYAQLAHCVFDAAEENDQMANELIAQAVAYLSELIKKLAAKNAGSINSGSIALVGGLAKKIEIYLSVEIRALLSPPLASPDIGAYYWQKNLNR